MVETITGLQNPLIDVLHAKLLEDSTATLVLNILSCNKMNEQYMSLYINN